MDSFASYDKHNLVSSSHLTVSQNIELRNLLNECNRMRCNGNLLGWRWKQDALRAELEFDLERLDNDLEQKDKYATKLARVEAEIEKCLKNKALLYKYLDSREKILRHLQEKAGKGTKRTFEDDDDDD